MGTSWNLQSQLLVAIQNNDLATAEFLLSRGVDADTRFYIGSQKRPAICLCVERGHVRMTQLLLKYGCSINQYDSSGFTPLHIAASYGHIKMVELLLQNRANVKAVTYYGLTALHFGAKHASLETIRLLVEGGSDIDRQDHDGHTPLILACIQNNIPVAQYLIEKGADVNKQDSGGNTPLLYAISGSNISLQLITLLLNSGSEVNHSNKQGETPLLAAVRRAGTRENEMPKEDNIAVVDELLDNECDMDVCTSLGQSPLHLAVIHHQDALAQKLIAGGCDLDSCDNLGLTPLFHLARDGKRKLVAMMVAAGVNLRKQRWLTDPNLLPEIWDIELRQFLLRKLLEFPSLSSLCRNSLRQHLGRKCDSVFDKLPLPSLLVNFLKLKVVDC